MHVISEAGKAGHFARAVQRGHVGIIEEPENYDAYAADSILSFSAFFFNEVRGSCSPSSNTPKFTALLPLHRKNPFFFPLVERSTNNSVDCEQRENGAEQLRRS